MTDFINNAKERVSNSISSISNNVGSISSSLSATGDSIYKNTINNLSSQIKDDSTMINAGNEYLHSNNIVAKFAFLFLILIIFILLLNLGINIIDYFMNPSVNPYIIKGSLDGKNSVIITQDPKDINSVPVLRSNNESSGIEFSWSVWLLLKNNSSDKKYKNIFNKGDSYYSNNSGNGISLVNNGPGLYLSSLENNQNILHVVMDTVNPELGPSVVDVGGLPFNKWFHVCIRVKNKLLDVYVNGTIASRHIMKFVPKQNYNDINICQNGGFDGQLSNLQYHSRALSAPEINYIVIKGANKESSQFNSSTINSTTPYFLSNAWYRSQR